MRACLYLKDSILVIMKDVADLIGRIFLASLFLYEAYDSMFFFDKNLETLVSYGLTWNPRLLMYAGIMTLVIGGILVLIGYYARVGAFLLLLYWLPFSLIVYGFWNDPEDLKRLHGLMLMRNLSLCGGLLLLLAHGSGKFSVRRLIHRLRLPK